MVNVIDYVPGTTLLHRLNPVTKIALAVALIASSLTADSPIVLVSLLALTLAASAYAHVMRQVRSFLKLLIPLSIIMFVMQAIFVRSGTPVFLSITNEGLMLGLMVCLRLLCLALPLCIPLLISSVGKTDATALAAEQRGFYLRTRASAYKRYPLAGRDIAALALCVGLIVLGIAC